MLSKTIEQPPSTHEPFKPKIEVFDSVLGPAAVEFIRAMFADEDKIYQLMKLYLSQEWPSKEQAAAHKLKAWQLRAKTRSQNGSEGNINLSENPEKLERESQRSEREASRIEILKKVELERAFFNFLCQCFPHLKKYQAGSDYTALNNHLEGLMESANRIIDEIRDTAYPGKEENLGLLNQTEYPAGGILAVGRYLLGNHDVSNRFKYELQRQLGIVLLLLQIEEKMGNGSYRSLIKDLEAVFEKHLYDPEEKIGETNTLDIYSLHSYETNTCLSFTCQEPIDQPPSDRYWKKETMQVRTSNCGKKFTTQPREKTPTSTVAKMIAKALQRGSESRIAVEDIEDYAGIKFITFSEEDQLELYNEIETIILQSFKEGVVSVTPDDEVGNGRGQSAEVKWKRMKVRFHEGKHQGKVIEILIFNYQRYLDYKYSVDGGFESGLAHSLFGQRRMWDVASILFEHYDIFNINQADVETSRSIEEQLEIQRLRLQNYFFTKGQRESGINSRQLVEKVD